MKPCNCGKCVDGGEGRCLYTGKPLPFDHEESIRNRKIAQHVMKQQQRQDAGLRLRFAKEQAAEKAKEAELSLFTAMMEER